MSRLMLMLVMSAVLLAGCERSLPPAELEEQASSATSLDELLLLHDTSIAPHHRDIYFVEPIGRYGKEGVLAVLAHIGEREHDAYALRDVVFFIDVAIEAHHQTGYALCEDVDALTTIEQLSSGDDVVQEKMTRLHDKVKRFCSESKRIGENWSKQAEE